MFGVHRLIKNNGNATDMAKNHVWCAKSLKGDLSAPLRSAP